MSNEIDNLNAKKSELGYGDLSIDQFLNVDLDGSQRKIAELAKLKKQYKQTLSDYYQDDETHSLGLEELKGMPKKEYIVDKLFSLGDIGMIIGMPGCGKSFVLMDLIASMVCGTEFASQFNVQRPLNVAYCTSEGIGGVPYRVRKAFEHSPIKQPSGFSLFRYVPEFARKSDERLSVGWFLNLVRLENAIGKRAIPDVICIDTFACASSGLDENLKSDMDVAFSGLKRIARELGCAIILAHHTNKSGKDSRGSSSIDGTMDFILKIDPVADPVQNALSCQKLKDDERWLGRHEFSVRDARVVWSVNNPSYKPPCDYGLEEKILGILKNNPEKEFSLTELTSETAAQEKELKNFYLNRLVREGKVGITLTLQTITYRQPFPGQ